MLHLPAWIVRTVPREVNLIVTWHYQNVFTAYPVIHRYLGAFVLNIKKSIVIIYTQLLFRFFRT